MTQDEALALLKAGTSTFLTGPPGSGKGTQGAVLGEWPFLVHISMGDIFRTIPRTGKFGQEIERYTSQGLMVPDELTVRVFERHLMILDLQELITPEEHTLILDGLPRSYAQAERLHAFCEGASTPAMSLLDDDSGLTPREREIAELAARGLSSPDIARQLVVSVRTVDNHLQHVYAKLGISRRAELGARLGRS